MELLQKIDTAKQLNVVKFCRVGNSIDRLPYVAWLSATDLHCSAVCRIRMV
jgi:hypothetical protein